jgi:hypothetical protein
MKNRHLSLLWPAALGVAAALLFVGVVTWIAGSDTSVWWWPAAAVTGAFCGAVMGALFGVEAEGESPDEAYDGAPPRPVRPAGR